MIKSLLSKKLGELRITRTELSRATGIRLNTISALYNDVLDRVSMDQSARRSIATCLKFLSGYQTKSR